MKINKEKVEERLASVPEGSRSHIYDASIVLEFLTATFMPTKFFLPEGFATEPGSQLGAKSMRKVSEGKSMMLRDLYDTYLLFREEKDYTARIESRYIFGIIVRHLRFYKNDWEFIVYRVGTAQIWHTGPLVMRKDVSAEIRSKYSHVFKNKEVEKVTVKADPVTEPEEEEEKGIDLVRDELGPDAPRVTVILEDVVGSSGEPISNGNFIGPKPDSTKKNIHGEYGTSEKERFIEVPDNYNDPLPKLDIPGLVEAGENLIEASRVVIGIDRSKEGSEDKSIGLLGRVENGALVVDKIVEIEPDSRFKEAKGNVRPDLYEPPDESVQQLAAQEY